MGKIQKKSRLIESGPGLKAGLQDLGKGLSTKSITAGVVAAIFGCTGPALIVIKASTDVGFTLEQTISWLFGIYVFGGLISIILALWYKMPINGAYSIPGAVMMGTALMGYSFNEAAGAFILAGVFVLLLGISGLIGKVMRWLPLPIVMGMIAGAMMKFGVNIVTSTQASAIIGGAAIAGFLVLPKILKRLPPVLSALLCGLIAAIATNSLNFQVQEFAFTGPMLVVPQFNVSSILSVSVPLAVLVVGAENAQAIGVLRGQGYKPPINMMTIISGIGGIVAGLFGAHNANIAGPMTAICSSEEAGDNKEYRYTATIVNGILFGAFGIIASVAMLFVSGLPSALINILAGLAMINVLTGAFKDGFGTGRFKNGAFAALIIGLSGISVLGISAPFWSLLGGVIVSVILDNKDFDDEKAREKEEALQA